MSEQTVYGAAETKPRTKVRTHHLQKWKSEGHKWAMLTAYDYSTARVFDDAEHPGAPGRRLGGQRRLRLRHHGAGDRSTN